MSNEAIHNNKQETDNRSESEPSLKRRRHRSSRRASKAWIKPLVWGGVGIFAAIVSSILGQGNAWWVKWGIIPASIAAGSFGIYEFLQVRRKCSKPRSAIIASCACLLLLISARLCYLAAPSKPGSEFSITESWVDDFAGSTKNDPPTGWIVEDGRATRLYSSILVSFVNLKKVPITIDSYTVEGETTYGTWEEIIYQTKGHSPKIFSGADPKNVQEIQYETFDSAMQRKMIGPNETVSGWVFVTRPRWKYYFLRFRFTDSNGISHIQKLDWTPSLESSGRPELQKITPNFVDISGLPISK
jgi:hypothetical protein